MKKIILFFIFFNFLFIQNSFCAEPSTQPVSMVPYESCYKYYNTDREQLFFAIMAAISNSNFRIKEIQSQNGYILFDIWDREFLATVSNRTKNSAFVKITPANGNYFFSPWIIKRIFTNTDYILNSTIQPQLRT